MGNTLSWFVFGDFNEILYSFEKRNGAIRDKHQMDAFQSVLLNCKLNDVGYEGLGLLGREVHCPIIIFGERLDRGIANNGWLLRFPSF